jgi:GNAT superfamily N-acetyltransferase
MTVRIYEPEDAYYFIATREGDRLSMLGWARVERDDAGRRWFAVSVEEVHRGGGIGRDLLARACAWADKHEYTLYLTSKPHVVEWYASAGFVQCSAWDGFTCKPGQVLMERLPMDSTTCTTTGT